MPKNRAQYLRLINQRKLIRIMRNRRLKCRDVARLACVKEQTVRTWRSGRYAVPASALRLLELQ